MEFLRRLFDGPPPDAAAAERLLVGGREALWRREIAAAEVALTRSARGHARPAVPRAYLSLARRMRGDFAAALKDADAAVALDDECLEAHAARAAALLSAKRLVDACMAFRAMSKRTAHDRDGHALRVLMTSLFAETIANAAEGRDEIRLDFQLTPAATCAILTLDGRLRAAIDGAARADNSTVLEMAAGAAAYFAGLTESAAADFARAAEAFPPGGSNASLRLSLLLLSKPV